MKIKKFVSVLAVTSIIGTTVVTPLNTLSTEAFAALGTQAVTENPNLMLNPSFAKETETATFKFKNWLTGDTGGAIDNNPFTYTQNGNEYTTQSGNRTIRVNSPTEFDLMLTLNPTNVNDSYFSIGQFINTEIGKEYTVSVHYKNSGANNPIFRLIGPSAVTSSKSEDTLTMTFTATASQTKIYVLQNSTQLGLNTTTVSNFSAVKSDYQMAKDAVSDMFEANGKVKSTVDQAWVDEVQAQVDLVTDPTKKQELQTQLDKAKQKVADQVNQDAASKAVKELFTNNDTTSDSIKSSTDQAAIDAAKALVDQIIDPTIKRELEADITKAQNLLDEKMEQINQDAASKAVKELFTNDDPSSDSIKKLTDQAAIDAAKALVNLVTDPSSKKALEADITKAQNLLDKKIADNNAATQAVKELFTNNDTASNSIKGLTDQAAIDAAKALVGKVTDSDIKTALEADITKAQNLLNERTERENLANASQAVKELFTNNDTASDTIKNVTSQTSIDAAKALVNLVTDATAKSALEDDIAKAQNLLDERTEKESQAAATKAVEKLFKDDDISSDAIKKTTDQTDIDAAQQLVNTVTDPAKKSELQQAINKAQRQLELGEVTIDTYNVGSHYITGTTETSVTKVGIYVNGKLIRTATASNGTYQIYASTLPELQVAGQAFEIAPIATDGTIGLKSNSVVAAKILPAKIAKPTIDNYFTGDKYITGSVSTDAKRIALYIDGQFVRYGAVTNGTFSIYAFDVAQMNTEGQTFEVVAVDDLGYEGERASSEVKVKTPKGNVSPNASTTLSTYNTGTVTGDVYMIALYVDGNFVRYGAVTGTDYKVYIYDVPALRVAGTTFEIKALDTVGNILYTSTQTIQ
ncbi:hypothetical protein HCB69_05675 [Listeria booriae]|uniref:Bacterial Ig domain-containing protein n=1 Tax=Listeria booriae TaxID=1552123 RepID=A0A842G699_9LIST|nr:toxin Cry1Ac domain D-VI-related protein [Listeria booriae]MBC2283860.1 hypothetical protein [Listeria booriae]MBC2291640.1 hypothetical protein [Listeria booriae]